MPGPMAPHLESADVGLMCGHVEDCEGAWRRM